MTPGRCDPITEGRARALAESLEAVGAELRLVDVADYIAYIRHEQLANLQDIVNSSVELFFKPGTLTFGWAADCELDWTGLPTIGLGMEFRHREIWIVFKLILRADEASVTIEHLVFAETDGNVAGDTERLIAVLADARLPDLRDPGPAGGRRHGD